MEKAYIILAHKNELQVKKLLDRLDDGKSNFFLHLDKNASSNFEYLKESNKKLHWILRVYSEWGGIGLVQATINGIKAVLSVGKEFDKIILLSGQDYPIKSNHFINQFFSASPFKNFLEFTKIPDFRRWKPGGGMYRVNKYFLGLMTYQRYMAKTLNLLARLIPGIRRKQIRMVPYAGCQWWAIDMVALRYIVEFLDNNPFYERFHKYTFAPDELFFHTILLNASNEQIRAGIKNDHLHFMKWENTANAHPDVLTQTDIHAMVQSPALFARKFDMETDPNILHLIDESTSDVATESLQRT